MNLPQWPWPRQCQKCGVLPEVVARRAWRLPLKAALGALLAALAAGGVVWWGAQQLQARQRLEERRSEENLGNAQSYYLSWLMERAVASLPTLSLLAQSGLSDQELPQVAGELMAATPAVQGMLLAPGGVVKQAWPPRYRKTYGGRPLLSLGAGLPGAEAPQGEEGGPAVTLDWLGESRHRLLAKRPVYQTSPDGETSFWGHVAVVISLPRLFASANLHQLPRMGYHAALWRLSPGAPLLLFQTGRVKPQEGLGFDLAVPGGRWRMLLGHTGEKEEGWPAAWVWGGAALAGLLAGFLAWRLLRQPYLFRQQVLAQTTALRATNHALHQEVSDRASAQEQLRASEERYALAAQGANDALFDWNLITGRAYLSPRFMALLGCGGSGGQQGVLRWLNAIHPQDRSGFVHLFQQHMLGHTDHFENEHRLRRPGGGVVWVLSRGIVVRGQQGQPVRLVGSLGDVTERQNHQRALEDTNRRLIKASQAKSDFLATMSHEIRTPLNGVIGMTALLGETPLTADQRDYLRLLSTSADTLMELLGDILDFSKIEAGRLKLVNEPFCLDSLVSQLGDMFRPRATARGLDFSVSVDPDLPRGLLGDAGRLKQVLVNLVGNAVKFTREGGVAVRLEQVGSPQGQAWLKALVRDTGMGIAPEAFGLLFQPFSQVDGAITRRFEGTGLGLAIVRELVELMGGRVGVSSQPGQGATFWFEIPLRQCDAQATPCTEPEPAQEAWSRTRPVRALKVLVVEDNPVNRELMAALLTRRGHQALLAEGGGQALALLAREIPDVVLLDVMMPGMSGHELARRWREREKETGGRLPLVALTANATQEDRAKCLASGMDDYLSKPFHPQALFDLLERWGGAARPDPSQARGNVVVFPSPAVASAAAFDWRALLGLVGGDTQTLESLVDLYLANSPGLLGRLGKAVERRDQSLLGQAAHALKGSSLNLGAVEVATLTARLEAMGQAQHPDWPQAAELVAASHGAFACFCREAGEKPWGKPPLAAEEADGYNGPEGGIAQW